MLVQVGLRSAKEGVRQPDDSVSYRPLEGLRVLYVHVPEGRTTGDAFRMLTDSNGVVRHHSDEVPGWVYCEGKPALQALLAEHYECAEGIPDDVERTHHTLAGPPTGEEGA